MIRKYIIIIAALFFEKNNGKRKRGAVNEAD